MPFVQLSDITHIFYLWPAGGPAIVKKTDIFRKSQSVPFCDTITCKLVFAMNNKSCPEEMENWTEKPYKMVSE